MVYGHEIITLHIIIIKKMNLKERELFFHSGWHESFGHFHIAATGFSVFLALRVEIYQLSPVNS